MKTQTIPSGSATWRPPHYNSVHWLQRAAQWLVVGLAHVVVLGTALYASPPAFRAAMPNVIQGILIAPRLLESSLELSLAPQPPQPPPEKPPEPEKPRVPRKAPPIKIPEKPQALLVATSVGDDSPAPAFEVAQLPADPPQSVSAAMGSASASAGDSSDALILPIFNADYLDNPKPPYPQLSRRYGETGLVRLRVYVSANGRAERVEIDQSSGFERLDTAARNAVFGWRFTPARRGNERVAAWVLIPISFVM